MNNPSTSSGQRLPSGTVTFLFTDIEGSTKLAREHREVWESARARHQRILRKAIEANQGYVFQVIGDAFCAGFHTAEAALRAAVNSQVDLHVETWGDTPIKVRMGIHTGKAELQENGEYHGYLAMSRVQRLMSAGHGGQVLISAASQELLLEQLPKEVSLRDLGERRLKDLIRPEHIYQLVIPGLPVEFPPLKTLDIYRHNLPVQLTSFIGREKEIEEIQRAILGHRLVTLTGVGGTGKTRLALQVSADVLDQFPNGVWFVELASITDPDLILQTLLSALGIPEQPGLTMLQQLLDYLRAKKLLLVVDNCEHLIEPCAKLAEKLVGHTLELRIMTTSREALGVQGEMIWSVPSLSLPDVKRLPAIEQLSQYEAVQLFIDRATLVQPHFAVTNDTAPAVAQICYRLDGIPLAIELAAARLRALDVEQIAQRLDDRFRLLTGGSRTALERHQTLRATIDWSYNLLSAEEKLLFARLSIFSGGWTLEAAEQVCSEAGSALDILDLLAHLVDKSLGILDGSRYHMLETIRQYASEKSFKSGEVEALRERHFAYFLDLAEQADRATQWLDKQKWKDRIELDDENFRAALEWCVSKQNTSAALRLLAVWWPNGWHHFGEMQNWFNRVRILPEVTAYPTPYAGLLNEMAGACWLRGNDRYAKSLMEESQAIWLSLGVDGERGLATAYSLLGEIALRNSEEIKTAQSLFEQSFELYQRHDDESGMARVMIHLGHKAMTEENFVEAEKLILKGIARFKEQGNLFMAAYALNELGETARSAGDYNKAGKYYEQGINDLQQLGIRHATKSLLFNCAWVSLHQGNHRHAWNQFKESFELSKEDGDTDGMILCLAGFASVLGMNGKPEAALRLFGALEHLYEDSGARPLDPDDQREVDYYMAAVREQLDEAIFKNAWTEGRTMTLEQAVAFALENNSD